MTSIGLLIWRVCVWIPYLTQKLASHALFKSMAQLSIDSTFFCHKSLSRLPFWTGAMGQIPVTLKDLGCLGAVLLVELGRLSDLRMADGLMALVNELNLKGVSPVAREVLGLEAEGAGGHS